MIQEVDTILEDVEYEYKTQALDFPQLIIYQ